MSPIRCLIFFGIIASAYALVQKKCLRGTSVSINERRKCTRCPYAFRCSPYPGEELAWALEDGVCIVFANGCMKGSYNCSRKNECKSEIVDSNQTECQQCCASGCESSPQQPHYGWVYARSSDGTSAVQEYCKNFASECEAKKWACENSTPLTSITPGNCP